MVQTLKNNKYKKYAEMNNSEKQLVFKFINSNIKISLQ